MIQEMIVKFVSGTVSEIISNDIETNARALKHFSHFANLKIFVWFIWFIWFLKLIL